MTAPTAAELAIIESPANRVDYRLAITVNSRCWDGPRTVDFTAAPSIDPAEFFATQYAGPPAVGPTGLAIQSYGQAPRELVITRPHFFPSDPTLDIDIDIWATFPTMDPIYSAAITVGSFYQIFGVEGEPLRVEQRGSAIVGATSSSVGRVYIHSAGQIDGVGFVNDQAEHKYSLRWRPNASGVPGDEKLTVLFDDGILLEASDAGFAVQPLYIAYGLPQSTRKTANVTPISGEILLVRAFDVSGPVYEDPEATVPPWCTENRGRTIEEAAERERFTQDGKEWAIVPQIMLKSVSAAGGRKAQADEMTAELYIFDPENPENLNVIGTDFANRTATLDMRTTDPQLGSTRYLRRASVVIDKDHWAGGVVAITGRDRPMSRLDVFFSKAYTSITSSAQSEGTFSGFNVGYSLGQALYDMIVVADYASGELLGAITAVLFAPDINPKSLSTGAQSLAAAFVEACDRSALEVVRFYDTSGQRRYGEINVRAYTLGDVGDTPVREFFGYDRPGENIVAFEVDHSRHDGIGMVDYRQNHPSVGNELLSLQWLPLVGSFPSVQYPPGDRVLSDTLSFLETTGLSVLTSWPRTLTDTELGGVGRLRYRIENQHRHTGRLSLANDPFPEPCEIVSVDDPNETGTPAADRWVVDGWSMSGSGQGELETTLDLINVDWARAILRQNP